MKKDIVAIGKIIKVMKNKNILDIMAHNINIKVTFLKDDVFRVWGEPTGIYEDPTKGKIIGKNEEEYKKDYGLVNFIIDEKKKYYKVSTEKITIRLYKNPFILEVYKCDNITKILGEKEPLQYGEGSTTQVLDTRENEYFYGGGVQNGYFSHKNRKVYVKLRISHWNDGSVSNPAPFFMSTGGYGVFRNTFKPGEYDFREPIKLTHEEERFDCFYFIGDTLGEILDKYTELTGRPTLIPRWGFSCGDANCYKETLDAMKVVNKYVENQFPRGWILPNDGYGCGYTNLKEFVYEAEKHGFKVGLWTENSVDKITYEVEKLGTRLVKTDVAWVGLGYEFALDGVKSSYDGIENNSNSRGYVWTCCGWSGTQRYSTLWTGDQSGDWEYIRFHIPTYIGAGLSGMPYIGSDIDGIFGGSAKTQVRDIQWKAFTPIMINMSGWAKKNKQPWVWGEPYTSYNRTYLNLKQRLTPYMYTYAHRAYEIGSPIIRGMLWDYPENKFALSKDAQYQFMLGDSFLVAPVFQDTDIRHGIYLPNKEQIWIDYINGERYRGGRIINNFKAPLWKLPLFIKSGSIIPMYPQGNYDGEIMPDKENPITYDIYPSGKTTFELYEDDGNTKEHREGKYAKTMIISEAPVYGIGEAIIEVNGTKGVYCGISEERINEFIIHSKVDPNEVILTFNKSRIILDRVKNHKYNSNTNCWYYDKEKLGGIVFIKTSSLSIRESFKIKLDKFSNELEELDTTNLMKPNTPQNIEIINVKDTSIEIGWNNVEHATHYDLLIDGILYTNVSNPYIHKNLDFVTTYKYKLRASNKGALNSPWSKEIEGVTLESSLKDVVPYEEMRGWASSYEEGQEPQNALNEDLGCVWHSKWGENAIPATFIITMEHGYNIDKFEYLSRRQGSNGNITRYNLSVSLDGINYNTLIKEGTWLDNGLPNMVEFKESVLVKYIKIEALEGKNNFASAVSFRPYRVKESHKIVVGDYTGTGEITENDLTFVKNYFGVKKGDRDWEYVSKCDINYNSEIDIYDIAFIASKIETQDMVVEKEESIGNIGFIPEKEEVKNGEEFYVDVIGENLKNLYAFQIVLNLDIKEFQSVACNGRCGKDVLARRTDLTDTMINCSTIREKKEGINIFVALTEVGNKDGINNDGVLATIKLKAMKDIKVSLKSEKIVLIKSKAKK